MLIKRMKSNGMLFVPMGEEHKKQHNINPDCKIWIPKTGHIFPIFLEDQMTPDLFEDVPERVEVTYANLYALTTGAKLNSYQLALAKKEFEDMVSVISNNELVKREDVLREVVSTLVKEKLIIAANYINKHFLTGESR